MAERQAGAERHIEIDMQDQAGAAQSESDALRQANARAEKAEAELASLKKAGNSSRPALDASGSDKASAGSDTGITATDKTDGAEQLRQDPMMAHLLDSLDAGKDIGHYGRLVFAMVARHFLSHDDVLARLTKDRDFSEEQASLMLRQVEDKEYSPPRRERILEWQREQEFPILPDPQDPDSGNVYRNLKFPEKLYAHIGHYQEEKQEADE